MNLLKKTHQLRRLICIVILVASYSVTFAQNITVRGKVIDQDDLSVIGATVVLKSNPQVGVMTDLDGFFELKVPANSTLTVSYMGLETTSVKAVAGKEIMVKMKADATALEEVVVVGFGQQSKASVVGAIAQVSSEVLERSAGVPDIGSALTGNLPGVITTSSTGMPGEEDPEIVIRSASSWNNSAPLVLVDGIERPISSVDINSVASVSVLKDASATAVYGVKGANGVILFTTKRGQDSKAKVNINFNSTVKVPSQLPDKYDSYDALRLRNQVIEHELGVSPNSWAKMTPQYTLDKYRNPLNQTEAERYPNIDWTDAIFKDYTTAYNLNVNAIGGNKVVKYFAGIDFQHEGDLFEQWDNGRGYNTEYSYNRLNTRTNLDFDVTKSTKFSVNLLASVGMKREPHTNNGNIWEIAQRWNGAYGTPPNAFYPIYEDGSFGFYPDNTNVRNPVSSLILGGDAVKSTVTLNTDFILVQKLDFITKGLSARGTISWDNVIIEQKRGINDNNMEMAFSSSQSKYVDPETGDIILTATPNPETGFDFIPAIGWKADGGSINTGALQRRLSYQAQLNYGRKFGEHDVTAMGVFKRQEYAIGSQVAQYYEDWAFRMTYNYNKRYYAEYNGAYNGSEKFSEANRFAFFQSGALGWALTEENFMEPFRKYLTMLKFRVSYGLIGDDNINGRWLYLTQWAYGNNIKFEPNGDSPYTWYREATIGNPDVQWETVSKLNYGFDYSILEGMFAGSVDIFRDHRYDILINGAERAEPTYFGAKPPTANLGEMKTRGYEVELRFNKKITRDLHVWANANFTHAENEVVKRADPLLKPDYQKAAGHALGQNYSYVNSGFIGNYDQLYGSAPHDVYNTQRLPGDYNIVDFNCDGIIDSNDQVPYEFSGIPQNTYNATVGVDFKGWNLFLQFYGVTNVSRSVDLNDFDRDADNVYNLGKSWWSIDNPNADVTVPRYLSQKSGYSTSTQHLYDGSYIRLKSAELGYTFDKNQLKSLRLNSLKIYLSGNNLWLWSRMPDDRESNYAAYASTGAYPTMRRFNLGLKIGF